MIVFDRISDRIKRSSYAYNAQSTKLVIWLSKVKILEIDCLDGIRDLDEISIA
jgi:hypothetical protein